jgi:hypothetical protein|tara:strand:- start:48 stop:422 length:375 start_codon:yes stop_codon:yes gene_type:complete
LTNVIQCGTLNNNQEKGVIMNTWKENCVAHVVIRFEERFEEEDFITKSKKWGDTSWKEEVLASILSAKKTGIKVGNGKGWREIYKVKYMPKTKSVFVVWDMALECAVTVFPAEWWDRKIKEYGL